MVSWRWRIGGPWKGERQRCCEERRARRNGSAAGDSATSPGAAIPRSINMRPISTRCAIALLIGARRTVDGAIYGSGGDRWARRWELGGGARPPRFFGPDLLAADYVAPRFRRRSTAACACPVCTQCPECTCPAVICPTLRCQSCPPCESRVRAMTITSFLESDGTDVDTVESLAAAFARNCELAANQTRTAAQAVEPDSLSVAAFDALLKAAAFGAPGCPAVDRLFFDSITGFGPELRGADVGPKLALMSAAIRRAPGFAIAGQAEPSRLTLLGLMQVLGGKTAAVAGADDAGSCVEGGLPSSDAVSCKSMCVSVVIADAMRTLPADADVQASTACALIERRLHFLAPTAALPLGAKVFCRQPTAPTTTGGAAYYVSRVVAEATTSEATCASMNLTAVMADSSECFYGLAKDACETQTWSTTYGNPSPEPACSVDVLDVGIYANFTWRNSTIPPATRSTEETSPRRLGICAQDVPNAALDAAESVQGEAFAAAMLMSTIVAKT